MSELIEIETFVAVAETGSFAAAARRLGLTPAMVGRRVRGLEERHGVQLIERSTRRQRLTDTGERFRAHCETVLDAVAGLNEITQASPGGLSGRVRATGPATLGTYRLSAIAARFCAQHPGVTLELSLNDRRADLVGEGFDLAVRVGPLRPSSLIARRVATYTLACVASPAYLSEHGTPATPGGLSGHHCILNLNMTPRNLWPFVDAAGRTEVAEVDGTLQIDNGEAQLVAALAGAGIVYLPLELVGPHLAAGNLVRVLKQWQTLTMPIHILQPPRRYVPRQVRALVEALAEGLRDTAAPVEAPLIPPL